MNFLTQVIIFIMFLGPLVFFHELGHFLFARLFGVRVEVFSIGFGPKVFKKKWGDTEYALSIIPLGGYVKMFGDDPMKRDEIDEREREFSFTHKGKWARFWIVLGGPLANFILAYFIFFSLSMVGEKVPELKIGHVSQEKVLYEKGLRTGDILEKVNSSSVATLADIAMIEQKQIDTVTVSRFDETINLDMNLSIEDFLMKVSTLEPRLEPIFINSKKEEFRIKLPTGQKIALQDLKEGSFLLEDIKDKSKFENITLTENFYEDLRAMDLYPIELRVNKASETFPAFKSGIRPGDLIVQIDGVDIHRFTALRKSVTSSQQASLKVTVLRDGELKNFSMTPETREVNGQNAKIIGVENTLKYYPVTYTYTESKGIIGSIQAAWSRTVDSTNKVASGFKKLIVGDVALDKIGGPLMIGKVASDSLSISMSMFFVFMSLVSINLGLINLFPIPVLDGGHIMFILFEIVNRGPLSQKKMEYAQKFGLSILLILMFFALKNDFTNFLG